MGNKGSKAKKKAGSAFKKLERKPFKTTNLPNIDDFFSKLQEPMDTLSDFSEAVEKANATVELLLTAEEIAKVVDKTVKGVMMYSKEEAKKSNNDFYLTVDDNGAPTLASRSEPEGFLAKAFNALKGLVDAIREVITNAPDLVNQIKEAGEASKDLPDKAKDDATSSGLNPLETGKAIKYTGDNIKYLGGFPNDVLAFIDGLKEFVKLMREVFGGGGEGEKKEGGEEKKE